MSFYQFIIKLIKTRIFKPSTIIIVLFLLLFVLYILPLFYHFVNKKLNPDLGLSKIRIGVFESSNKYRDESDKIIVRENPLPLVPPNSDDELIKQKDNEISRLKKQRTVALALTVATPTHQIKDSPIAIDLAESLKDLRTSDPNSEIIPLTEDFIRDYKQGKIKVENDVWH